MYVMFHFHGDYFHKLDKMNTHGSRVVQHHPSLNTYTLSVGTEPGGAPPNLQADILELYRLILSHYQGKVSQACLSKSGKNFLFYLLNSVCCLLSVCFVFFFGIIKLIKIRQSLQRG